MLRHPVFIVAGAHVSRVLPVQTVQVAGGEAKRATAVDEDADAAPPTCCQSKAATQAPSSYPLYQQGASPLHEEETQENAELLCKVSRRRGGRLVWQVHEVQDA